MSFVPITGPATFRPTVSRHPVIALRGFVLTIASWFVHDVAVIALAAGAGDDAAPAEDRLALARSIGLEEVVR